MFRFEDEQHEAISSHRSWRWTCVMTDAIAAVEAFNIIWLLVACELTRSDTMPLEQGHGGENPMRRRRLFNLSTAQQSV